MTVFYGLLLASICALIGLIVHKRRSRNALIRVFQQFNEKKDLNLLTHWIRARQTSQRLTAALDFLRDIEESSIAVNLLDAFNLENLQHRHILIFAAQAYLAERRGKALELADRLMEKYPGDDSALDLYINIHLTMGSLEKAKEKLMPRLTRKYKGTIFTRHYARILAKEGELEKAIELMEQVSKRDFVLFQNTFATPQKGQIRKQFEESQALLEAFREALQEKSAGQETQPAD